ncbi:MAG: ABC transporter ATP-binding protein [Chloroflexi bacterium]|nr:ABC transporter ATP-binding protein [Chloroflexota bacterium]
MTQQAYVPTDPRFSRRALVRHSLRPYARRIVLGLTCTVAAAGFALAWPMVLRLAVDSLSQDPTGSGLSWQAAQIVGLAAAEASMRFSSRWLIIGVSRRIECDLRARMFDHLLRLDALYYGRTRTGDLMARATSDLSAIRAMLGFGVQMLGSTVVLLIAAFILVYRIDPAVTLWAGLLLPAMAIVFAIFRGRLEIRSRAVQAHFSALTAQAEENLAGIRVIKSYAQETAEIEAFRATSAVYLDRNVEQVRLSGVLWPLMASMSGLTLAALLLVGGRETIEGRMTIGQYVQINAYLVMLTWPMIGLGWAMNLVQQGAASLQRVLEVLRSEPTVVDPARRASVESVARTDRETRGLGPRQGSANGAEQRAAGQSRGRIDFENVSLNLTGRWQLRDCSFTVPAGARIGIVGPTGSGKSLLVSLVPRLFDPTGGRVLVDGRDVRAWPLDALRRSIGFVPQETLLFSTSLAQNIALGVDETTVDAHLQRVAQAAQLSKDLPRWPDGIATVVGERGVTLSGGQKQRTAIARALLRDAPILILDDALASVDAETEDAILGGLRQFTAGRTCLIVAHRLSTVRGCDLILVLEDGRVLERGRHDELLAVNGLYARVYRRQQLSAELEDGRFERLAPARAQTNGTVQDR